MSNIWSNGYMVFRFNPHPTNWAPHRTQRCFPCHISQMLYYIELQSKGSLLSFVSRVTHLIYVTLRRCLALSNLVQFGHNKCSGLGGAHRQGHGRRHQTQPGPMDKPIAAYLWDIKSQRIRGGRVSNVPWRDVNSSISRERRGERCSVYPKTSPNSL